MGSLLYKSVAKTGVEKLTPKTNNFWALEAIDIDGNLRKMSEFQNRKALIVVNVALEMYKKYKSRGLEILAFPSNQFMGQEPWDPPQIKEFVVTKFGVDFVLFGKVNVNGEDCHEIYKYLRNNSPLYDPKTGNSKQIPWNFAKFLIQSDGTVHSFYGPKTEPKEIEPVLEKLL
ncbi:hypothetical protein ABPG74_003349 [Tetrahymena malaccensis]